MVSKNSTFQNDKMVLTPSMYPCPYPPTPPTCPLTSPLSPRECARYQLIGSKVRPTRRPRRMALRAVALKGKGSKEAKTEPFEEITNRPGSARGGKNLAAASAVLQKTERRAGVQINPSLAAAPPSTHDPSQRWSCSGLRSVHNGKYVTAFPDGKIMATSGPLCPHHGWIFTRPQRDKKKGRGNKKAKGGPKGGDDPELAGYVLLSPVGEEGPLQYLTADQFGDVGLSPHPSQHARWRVVDRTLLRSGFGKHPPILPQPPTMLAPSHRPTLNPESSPLI